jgi:hypothetical protein
MNSKSQPLAGPLNLVICEATSMNVPKSKRMHAPTSEELNKRPAFRAQAKLTAAINGQHMEVATAIAFRDRDEIKVLISNKALRCDDLIEGKQTADDEETLELILVPGKQPTGASTWLRRKSVFRGSTNSEYNNADVAFTGDTDVGKAFSITIDMSIEGQAKTLTAKGTVDVLMCAPQPALEP